MEIRDYLWALLALVSVLALIGMLAWAMRRMGWATGARFGTSQRLRVTETVAVDVKRKLVLVRRDNVEHLLLIGAEHDLVIESGIPVAAGHAQAEVSP